MIYPDENFATMDVLARNGHRKSKPSSLRRVAVKFAEARTPLKLEVRSN